MAAYVSNDNRGRKAYPAYTVTYNNSTNSNYKNGNSSALDGSLSPSTNLGLRKRDGVAIIISLLLLRLAFTPPSPTDNGGIAASFAAGGDSSIKASIELAFYSPFQSTPPNILNSINHSDQHQERRRSIIRNKKKREKTARPVPLDIDGDGVVESLVVPVFLKPDDIRKEQELEEQLIKANKLKKDNVAVVAENGWAAAGSGNSSNEGSWGLRVLTLKLMHHRQQQQQQLDSSGGGIIAGPFAPRTIFLSPLLPHSTKKTNNGEDDDVQTTQTTLLYPIKLLSVHIPIQRTHLGEEEKSRQRHKKINEGGGSSSSSSGGSYGKKNDIPRKDDPNFADYDHKRHYFCGTDWHHAANSCHKHCPDGISSSCADGEMCYADTPCDAHMPDSVDSNDTDNNSEESSTTMALTPRGTLPGIVTVWSDGSVSLHVVTADVPTTSWEGDSTTQQQHRPKRARQKPKPQLELRQMWRVYPLKGSSGSETTEDITDSSGMAGKRGDSVVFDELGVTFESGVIFGDENGDAMKAKVGNHGAVLIGGKYIITKEDGRQQPLRVSFHALDALTGTSLWELKGQNNGKKKNDTKQDFPIPIIHTTSSARRRSHLPTKDTLDPDFDSENSFIEGDDVMTSEECLTHFRSSVLNIESGALPHEFWDDGEYGSMSVGRFDRTKKSGGKRGRQSRKHEHQLIKNSLGGGHKKDRARSQEKTNRASISGGIALNKNAKDWQSEFINRAVPRRLINQQRFNAKHPRMGKPNVVLFHGHEGLAVLSLKNGRPVCHISLTDHALYADLDQDGKIDTVQVVTSPQEFSASSVQSLIQKITGEKKDHSSQPDAPAICHALVTSGVPPQEELFTAPLCLGGPSMLINPHKPQSGLSAAAPLLVEGSIGYGNDVVFAMNNGVIVRYDSNGREVWRKKGGLKDGTPHWMQSDIAFLGRIQFGSVKESHSSVSASSHRNQHRPGSPLRPILLSGEEGAALISPTSGRVLSSVAFPQNPVTSQPLLVDLNGDGTDDVLVVSGDGLWGYRVVVETGRSGFFRIVVVTLLVAIAIAALVHKTGQEPGRHKRSMDA